MRENFYPRKEQCLKQGKERELNPKPVNPNSVLQEIAVSSKAS